MNKPSDFRNQLADLTTELCAMVAERLSFWSKDMEPNKRRKINQMIEDDLPTVITNTIAKTPSLHSAKGVEYFEQNLENMAETYSKTFIGKI